MPPALPRASAAHRKRRFIERPSSEVKAQSKIRMMERISLKRPDDWHLHLRDGQAMASVLADSARQFGRAIVMPNLKLPVRTTQQALEYRERILAAMPAGR